jgi:AraC-like DNA-binding protein
VEEDIEMHLVYEDTKEEILAIGRRAKHQPPHLHQTLELVYVMKGSLELGVGLELFHMEEGDIGLVFPDVNHHCQVFSEQYSEVLYINIPTRTLGTYEELLKRKAPVYPVIKYGELPSEIYPAIQSMKGSVPKNIWIVQAYLQVIFVRCIPLLTLTEKSQVGSNDLIYQTVSYISANFRKSFLLEDMAKDLGVSKYVLSRVFSKTFHRNFNQYLNDARLGYAKQRLENTNDPTTNICLDSGFESQRTFNRVFKEKYMVSPSEYRRKLYEDLEKVIL